MSRLKQIARPIWSNPPIHGARLINAVLEDPALVQEWHRELKVMSGRMFDMRQGLYNRLVQSGSKHSWKHVIDQIGMFAYTGLNKEMVEELRNKYAIYMTADGRISICGLNTKNLDYIAESFYTVTKDKQF
jgi:aspartate/tyrosine/aromatic aminotransferase